MEASWWLVLFFIVGMLYASVGHGGASGYLAIMALMGTLAPANMKVTALCLNLVVAGLSFFSYARTGHFSWRLTFPFLIGSIPCAFLGGMQTPGIKMYSMLLTFALLASAWRLAVGNVRTSLTSYRIPSPGVAIATGGCIGWISGLIGIGGGVFLSPLMILRRWANVKTCAASSALFILVNSASGLLSQLGHAGVAWDQVLPLVISSGLGGFVGSAVGAIKIPDIWLRRVLAAVLLIACVKLGAKAWA